MMLDRALLAALPVSCLITFVAAQASVGTAFTYQGRLQAEGLPVNGTVDLTFALFDAPAGGNLVSRPIAVNGVAVSEGLFTVDLDFQSGAFDGQPRWLQIATEGVSLSPRQRVSPTPYAMVASSVISVPPGAIAGQYDEPVTFSSVDNVFAGSGALLSMLNASNIASGTLADARLSSNVPLKNAANTFTEANTFQGSLLLGSQASSSSEALRADRTISTGSGLAGGGPLTADLELSIAPGGVTAAHIEPGAVTTGAIVGEAVTSAELASDSDSLDKVTAGAMHIDGGNVGIGTASASRLLSIGEEGVGLDRPASNTLALYTANVERMRIRSDGRVGIGTEAPNVHLHVVG